MNPSFTAMNHLWSPETETFFAPGFLHNEPLSAIERDVLERDVFAKATTEMVRIDEHIAQLSAALAKVKEEKRVLVKTTARWRKLVSPFRSLPPEILSQIFGWFCKGFDVFSITEGPRGLERVCHRWREAVRQAPVLWTDFRIHPRTPRCNMLSVALSRSHSLPLTINLQELIRTAYNSTFSYSEVAEFHGNVMAVLLEHSQRWRHMKIGEGFKSLKTGLLEWTYRIPLLQELEIDAFPDEETDGNLFAIAPLLRTVTLKGPSLRGISLPWKHLRVLRLESSVTWEDAVRYLSDCPQLEELSLLTDFPSSDSSYVRQCIIHPKLRRLHLSDYTSMTYMNLPSLEELQVLELEEGLNEKSSLSMLEHVAGLIISSSCSLTMLVLQNPDVGGIGPFNLFDILCRTPRLHTLDLRFKDCDWDQDDGMRHLFNNLTPSTVPMLEKLSIDIRDVRRACWSAFLISFINEDFLYFIHSRTRTSNSTKNETRLKKVQIRVDGPVSIHDLSHRCIHWLRAKKAGGSDISITTTGVFLEPDGQMSAEFTLVEKSDGEVELIYV